MSIMSSGMKNALARFNDMWTNEVADDINESDMMVDDFDGLTSGIVESPIDETEEIIANSAPQIYGNINDYAVDSASDFEPKYSFIIDEEASFEPVAEELTETSAVAFDSNASFGDFSINFSFDDDLPEVPVRAEKPSVPEIKKAEPSLNTANVVKGSFGFNTTNKAAGSSYAAKPATAAKNTFSSGLTVDILRPTKVDDVAEACAKIKEGIIVVAVLSGISDKNVRLRYLDYFSGCCKGCDANFKEVVRVDSSDCVLVAVPSGVNLQLPVDAAAAMAAAATAEPAPAPKQVSSQPPFDNLFSSANFDSNDSQKGATNSADKGEMLDWYKDKF